MKASLANIRNVIWSEPDPLLFAAGQRGELLVAEIRLALASILLLIPIVNLPLLTDRRESVVGLVVTLGVVLLSLGAYFITRRDHHYPWMGFVTCSFDVTLVSLALASFFLFQQPHTAVNSKVVFEGYFLAIGATALRYDRRICVVAGVLCLVEYFAIVFFAATRWNLNDDIYAPFIYGAFSWSTQISRLILMLTASLLSLAVVARTQQLMRLSTSDPLTGVFNRGYFNDRIGVEFSRAARYKQPLAVAMVDVDRFKTLNDLHGHVVGDIVLRMVASALRHSFRKSDIVARYGGDEFIITMPETDTILAARRLEEFREMIANTPVLLPKTSRTITVSVSAGVAGLSETDHHAEQVVGLADARLFKAKAEGRNRVVAG